MIGGSQQQRLFRRAIREGQTVDAAAVTAGITLGEAKLIAADDLKNPPPPEAYELLGSVPASDRPVSSDATAGGVSRQALAAGSGPSTGEGGRRAIVPPKPVNAGTTTRSTTMAKKAKPNDPGDRGVTNLSETKEVVRDSVSKILKLRSERKEINAAISEQRARVKNYGVPPAALDLALRMKEADPQDRQLHDEGYAIARDALGLGIQRSLFEMLDERTGADQVAADAKAAQVKPDLTPGPAGDGDLAAAGETAADQSNAFVRKARGGAAAASVPDAVDAWSMAANTQFTIDADGSVRTKIANVPLGEYTPRVTYQVTAGPLQVSISDLMDIDVVAAADVTAPAITSPVAFTQPENAAWSTNLAANESVTWSKRTGADSALFSLAGATLSLPAQDYEGRATPRVANLLATDAAGNATPFTVTVTITDVQISASGTPPQGTVNSAYAGFKPTASGGAAPYSYAADPARPAPAGMSIDPTNGLVGTPTAEFSAQVGMVISDANGESAPFVFGMVVGLAPPAYEYAPDFSTYADGTDLQNVSGWSLDSASSAATNAGFKVRTRSDGGLSMTGGTDNGFNNLLAFLHEPPRFDLYFSFKVVGTDAANGSQTIILAGTDRSNQFRLRIENQSSKLNSISFNKIVAGAAPADVAHVVTSGSNLLGNIAEANFVIRRVAGSNVLQWQVVETGAAGTVDMGQSFGNKIGIGGRGFTLPNAIIRNLRLGELAPANPNAALAVVEDHATYTPQQKQFVVELGDTATFAQPQMRLEDANGTVLSDWTAVTTFQPHPNGKRYARSQTLPTANDGQVIRPRYRDNAMPTSVTTYQIQTSKDTAPAQGDLGMNDSDFVIGLGYTNILQCFGLQAEIGGVGKSIGGPTLVANSTDAPFFDASLFGITTGAHKPLTLPAGASVLFFHDNAKLPKDPEAYPYKAGGQQLYFDLYFTPGFYPRVSNNTLGANQAVFITYDGGDPALSAQNGHARMHFVWRASPNSVVIYFDHFDPAFGPMPASHTGDNHWQGAGKQPPSNYFIKAYARQDMAQTGQTYSPTAADMTYRAKLVRPAFYSFLAGLQILRCMSPLYGWTGYPMVGAEAASNYWQTFAGKGTQSPNSNFSAAENRIKVLQKPITPDLLTTPDSFVLGLETIAGAPIQAPIEGANLYGIKLMHSDNEAMTDAAIDARAAIINSTLTNINYPEKGNEQWNDIAATSRRFYLRAVRAALVDLGYKTQAEADAMTIDEVADFRVNGQLVGASKPKQSVLEANAHFDRYKAVSTSKFRKVLAYFMAPLFEQSNDMLTMLNLATDPDKLGLYVINGYNFGGLKLHDGIGGYAATAPEVKPERSVWPIAEKDKLASSDPATKAEGVASMVKAMNYTLRFDWAPALYRINNDLQAWVTQKNATLPTGQKIPATFRLGLYEVAPQHTIRLGWPEQAPFWNSAPAYVAGRAYAVGDKALAGGRAYKAIAPTTGNEPPNATYWVLDEALYAVGSFARWTDGHVYVATAATISNPSNGAAWAIKVNAANPTPFADAWHRFFFNMSPTADVTLASSQDTGDGAHGALWREQLRIVSNMNITFLGFSVGTGTITVPTATAGGTWGIQAGTLAAVRSEIAALRP